MCLTVNYLWATQCVGSDWIIGFSESATVFESAANVASDSHWTLDPVGSDTHRIRSAYLSPPSLLLSGAHLSTLSVLYVWRTGTVFYSYSNGSSTPARPLGDPNRAAASGPRSAAPRSVITRQIHFAVRNRTEQHNTDISYHNHNDLNRAQYIWQCTWTLLDTCTTCSRCTRLVQCQSMTMSPKWLLLADCETRVFLSLSVCATWRDVTRRLRMASVAQRNAQIGMWMWSQLDWRNAVALHEKRFRFGLVRVLLRNTNNTLAAFHSLFTLTIARQQSSALLHYMYRLYVR